jgi:hypothetical protein
MDVEGAVPPGGTPQPRQSISSLVFIIFFTIFLLSGNGEDPNKQLEMRTSELMSSQLHLAYIEIR